MQISVVPVVLQYRVTIFCQPLRPRAYAFALLIYLLDSSKSEYVEKGYIFVLTAYEQMMRVLEKGAVG